MSLYAAIAFGFSTLTLRWKLLETITQMDESMQTAKDYAVEVLNTQRSPRVRLNCQLDDVSFALQDDQLFGAFVAS